MSFDLFHRCLVSPLTWQRGFVHAYTAVLLSVDALLVLELVPSLSSILNMLDCLLVD